jgi:hypothetical protein
MEGKGRAECGNPLRHFTQDSCLPTGIRAKDLPNNKEL